MRCLKVPGVTNCMAISNKLQQLWVQVGPNYVTLWSRSTSLVIASYRHRRRYFAKRSEISWATHLQSL